MALCLFTLLILLMQFLCSIGSDCRFALKYNISGVLGNNEIRKQFLDDFFFWEQKFVNTIGISLDPHIYVTYDGSYIDCTTGLQTTAQLWSAASKESQHFMFIIHTLNDTQYTNISNQINIINIKLNAFQTFNQMYPGFGGFLPWFTIQQQHSSNNYIIIPAGDFQTKTPALDNGLMYWSLYGLKWQIIQNYETIIQNNPNININETLYLLQQQMNLMETNAKIMFYDKNGLWRSVAIIGNTSLSPTNPQQTYSGGAGSGDPFEGELFEWLLDLKSSWVDNENDQIWENALENLHAVNYTFQDGNNLIINITVQQGWHFSSHEQWKLLELPYLDIPLLFTIFENCEKVRSINSVLGLNGNKGSIPGMYASVNAPVNCTNPNPFYDGGAGIPSIAYGDTEWNFDIITPYSTMTMYLFNESIASAWMLNMIKGPKMQSIYGTVESILINGTEISPMVTWDSKITSYIGAKGGISKWTTYGLKEEGLYDRFVNVMTQQYTKIFGNDINKIKTNQDWAIPNQQIPINHMDDFTSCRDANHVL